MYVDEIVRIAKAGAFWQGLPEECGNGKLFRISPSDGNEMESAQCFSIQCPCALTWNKSWWIVWPGVASLKDMLMFSKGKNNNFNSLSTKYVCTCLVDATLVLRP